MKIAFDDMNPTLSADGVDMRTSRIGDDVVLMRVRCEPGTDFGPACKGLPHDACPCEHWGFVITGRMDVATHDGQTFSFGAGDAFHLLPGHMPTFPEATEWLDFSPRAQVEHLLVNMGIQLPG